MTIAVRRHERRPRDRRATCRASSKPMTRTTSAKPAPEPRPLLPSLARPGLHLIAEIKRRSPSVGSISVLTTTSPRAHAPTRPAAPRRSPSCASHTGSAGRWTICARSARPSACPVLAKEFVVDRRQLATLRWRRRGRGAAAGRAPSCPRAARAGRARPLDLGLEPLVEAHDERELERALSTKARLIGINNRDLRSLDVDPLRAERLRASCRTIGWSSPSRASATRRRSFAGGRSASTPRSSVRR